MRCWNSCAISEMISLIMVLFIVTGAITGITLWGVPYMEGQKVAVRWESALLQLDVMGDIIEDVLSEGVNSSKSMGFQTSEGEFFYYPQEGRFVIYYSVYTNYDLSGLPNSYTKSRFDFDVIFEDLHSFSITVNEAYYRHSPGDLIDLGFTVTRLDGSGTEDLGIIEDIALANSAVITFNTLELKDAVRIDIVCEDPNPPNNIYDYGRIWLFDVGTFVYRTENSEDNRVIIENGAVIAAHEDSGSMYNEPLYWSRELLDKNSMMNMRLIQMKEDEDIGINLSGSGGLTTEFIVTSNNSAVMVNRYPISYPLRMRIYGDKAAVHAWNLYYTNSVGFEEENGINDLEPTLEIDIRDPASEKDVKNLWFSLNHAIYTLGMEVR